MRPGGITPLQSLRLAEYLLPVRCVICEAENVRDAERCQHCRAPLTFGQWRAESVEMVHRVGLLGAPGVGKTVYLAMLLDILGQQEAELQLLARGAFSLNLQAEVIPALARCEFPDRTPKLPELWNWVHCQVRRRRDRRPWDLVIPDPAGEALVDSLEHPLNYPALTNLFRRADAAMLLIDAGQLSSGCRAEELLAVKLLSQLAELAPAHRSGKCRIPTAIILTKADQCEAAQVSPAGFLRTHAPTLWYHAERRLLRYAVFAVQIVGGCALRQLPHNGRVVVPLRVEPHGVLEPFTWLIDHLGRK